MKNPPFCCLSAYTSGEHTENIIECPNTHYDNEQ